MAEIKSVKKAQVLGCKDAFTKEAIQAVFSESHNAVYKNINIHTIKSAGVLKDNIENAHCVYSGFVAAPTKKAAIDCVHTDVYGCKKASKNITIEELFRNI